MTAVLRRKEQKEQMASPFLFALSYTPLSWWLIFYFLAYRHELSRLVHPVRERRGLRDWVAVLARLKLMDAAALAPAQRLKMELGLKAERRRAGRTKALYLLSFLVLWLSAVLVSKLAIMPQPLAEAALPALLQLAPAVPLIVATYRRCGAFPFHPIRYHLPSGRKGSLLKYLGRLGREQEAETPPSPSSAQAAVLQHVNHEQGRMGT